MKQAAVTWADLSERARSALGRIATLRARVMVKVPGEDATAEAVQSVLDISFTQPDLWRIDRDGELLVLRDGLRHLARAEDGRVELHRRPAVWVPGEEIGGLGWAHRDLFRDPPAFEDAVSGPVPSVVAGRAAFDVRLAAPGKKPYLLNLTLDAATGLVLRYAAEGTPYVAQVLDLVLDGSLPEDRFAWNGEYEDRRGTSGIDSAAAETAWRRQFEEMPVPRFWPAEATWRPVRVDRATGAFHAHQVRGLGDAVLVRTPVDGEAWEVSGPPHRHEWIDGGWRWTLLVHDPLDADDLARVRASVR